VVLSFSPFAGRPRLFITLPYRQHMVAI